MKIGKKFLLGAIVFMVMGVCATLSAVDNLTSGISDVNDPAVMDQPMGYENYWNCISRKLGRGISNVAFGVLEVPIRIYDVRFEEGGISAVTFGAINGVGYFIAREFVGLFEIITFPFPMPFTPNDHINGAGWGYGPILSPEWIVTPETDLWNTVFNQTAYTE